MEFFREKQRAEHPELRAIQISSNFATPIVAIAGFNKKLIHNFRRVESRRAHALHHVSCSPSKIPYVGFSPVRLQTGFQRRSSLKIICLKCEAHMQHKTNNLYATKAERPCPYSPTAFIAEPATSTAHPVQRPLARQALCCRSGSSLNMASSESVCTFLCLIFFVHWIFALRPRMGWYRQIPQFAPRTYNSVPSSVPRQPWRVHLVVSSPTVIAFAISAMARQPHPTHAGSHVGSVTRLQSSLYATARSLACPSPARTFTIELSPGGSPRSDVDYNYTANNQLPQPDLHRQDTRPYGLRAENAEKVTTQLRKIIFLCMVSITLL